MSEGQQLQETPVEAPAADAGTMVRACERCGTVCSADQEWCLTCGVRMSPVSQRLPGLRAAGLVVSLAVLLAGGAAAASYAALRSDSPSTAAAPAGPAGTPVTPSTTPVTPPPVTPADPPAVDPAPTTDTPTTDEPAPDDLEAGAPPADLPTDPPAAETPAPSAPATPPAETPTDSGADATDATDETDSTDDKAKDDETKTEKPKDESGPVTLASGQGSLYDPEGVVADRGDDGKAIDGNVKTGWTATLAEGKTGGYGFVIDFDNATALKTLSVFSPTKGLKVKVLGTTRATLPLAATDATWVELAAETTLKGSSKGTDLTLDGGKKLRHVLLLVTAAPGTPASSQINEIQVSR